ncbi:MAG TPA: diaminopimelate epimerase [Dehalococcoidia bacterium]|nr:diaminopimelate epimerase [Dehalococcoidia bacterium]
MNFSKAQGAGNDFILVEGEQAPRDWSRLAIAMCNRHFGIGGDGLIVILPSNNADFQMRMFNPDGSEAEACGNGLRCLVRYVLDNGMADVKAAEISVATMSGVKKARLHRAGGRVTAMQVGMGEPKFSAGDIPVAIEPEKAPEPILDYPLMVGDKELHLSFVSIGNPHAVYFAQQAVSDFPLSQLGPRVERHRIFPSRTNFEVARVLSRKQIEARVWERGAGETLACGSGACAIAVLARLHDYTDNKVDIKLPGGILSVEWAGSGEVLLSGPAETVFSGEWPDENVETD